MAKEILRDAKTVEVEQKPNETAMEKSKKVGNAVQDSVYQISELAANAGKLFGTRQECVTAALENAGKQEYSIAEAKKIVDKFLKKEVR